MSWAAAAANPSTPLRFDPTTTSAVTIDVLAPTLPNSTRFGTFNLHIEDIRHELTRSPVLFGLPPVPLLHTNNPFVNRPQTMTLDIGIMQEVWTFQGVCDDFETDVTYPNITLLQEIARCAGIGAASTTDDQGRFQPAVAVVLHVSPGQNQSPNGAPWDMSSIILGLSSHREAAHLYWDYQLRIAIADFPPNMQHL